MYNEEKGNQRLPGEGRGGVGRRERESFYDGYDP